VGQFEVGKPPDLPTSALLFSIMTALVVTKRSIFGPGVSADRHFGSRFRRTCRMHYAAPLIEFRHTAVVPR
jgi:hypothetical protein